MLDELTVFKHAYTEPDFDFTDDSSKSATGLSFFPVANQILL